MKGWGSLKLLFWPHLGAVISGESLTLPGPNVKQDKPSCFPYQAGVKSDRPLETLRESEEGRSNTSPRPSPISPLSQAP